LDIRLHALLIIILAIVVPGAPAHAATFAEQLRGLVRGPGAAGGGDFLPADEAFRFAAEAGADKLSLFWEIADGYYLYHDKFSFSIIKGGAGIRQDQVVLPAGSIKHDESFGSVEINTGDLSVDIPVRRQSGAATPIILKVSYQGCKEDSVCYPPVTKEIPLTLPAVQSPG
jgi:thiol:disulfide interchange protein DsbD